MIGALFVGLSLSGLADRLRVVFTPAVVRGIQLSVGILLVRAAWEEMVRSGQLRFRLAGGLEGPVIGMTVALVVAVAVRRQEPQRRADRAYTEVGMLTRQCSQPRRSRWHAVCSS